MTVWSYCFEPSAWEHGKAKPFISCLGEKEKVRDRVPQSTSRAHVETKTFQLTALLNGSINSPSATLGNPTLPRDKASPSLKDMTQKPPTQRTISSHMPLIITRSQVMPNYKEVFIPPRQSHLWMDSIKIGIKDWPPLFLTVTAQQVAWDQSHLHRGHLHTHTHTLGSMRGCLQNMKTSNTSFFLQFSVLKIPSFFKRLIAFYLYVSIVCVHYHAQMLWNIIFRCGTLVYAAFV